MSDHGSGPRAFADSTIDITDMYVFPSPERPGRLALVLNVFPFAGPTARFSDVVDYRLRIRPITAASPAGIGLPRQRLTRVYPATQTIRTTTTVAQMARAAMA